MRCVLTVLLLALATPARADWVKIASNSYGDTYIDAETIRKEGNIRKVWVLQDHRQAGLFGERSMKTQMEFDCKEIGGRSIAMSLHSGPMAQGATLGTDATPSPWDHVVVRQEGTGVNVLLSIVCAK